MSVLVAVASKHGSTRGIAEEIVNALHEVGVSAEVQSVDSAQPVEQHDGVILVRPCSRLSRRSARAER